MFEKEILERLKEMYSGGMTQDELSRRTGVSRPYLARMLSGKQPVKNPTVDLLFKVFPRASVNLTGDVNTAIADHHGTAIANAGQGNNFFAPTEQFRQKAIDAVIDLDLAPDAMQTVLRALKNLK